MRPPSEEIARLIQKIPARPFVAFRDWTQAVEDMLDRLPFLVQSVAETGEMCPDPPEMQERFRRLHDQYHDYGFKLMHEATAVLLDGSTDYVDVIGNAYMRLEIGNTRAGQYFTPQPIAEAMAMMTITDPIGVLDSRLREAAGKNLFTSMMGIHTIKDLTQPPLVHEILPMIIDDVEPIKIMDPACGSGVMLLAAAKQFPDWAVQTGVVQFFGQDIDALCCQLARINSKLYGLRGAKVKGEVLRALQRLEPAPPLPGATHEIAQVIAKKPEHVDDPPAADFEMKQLDLFPPLKAAS